MIENKVAKMSARMHPSEYKNANPIKTFLIPTMFGSAAVLSALKELMSKDTDCAIFMFVFMIISGVITFGADAYSQRLKNEDRAKRILASATRMYVKDVIANEVPSIDDTKPLLKDQKDMLSNKEAVNNLSNHVFNNLSKSYQQDAAKVLKELFIKFSEFSEKPTVSSLRATVKGIVNILKNHEHIQQNSIEDLYVQMVSENNKIYVKQQEAKNIHRK